MSNGPTGPLIQIRLLDADTAKVLGFRMKGLVPREVYTAGCHLNSRPMFFCLFLSLRESAQIVADAEAALLQADCTWTR